ncbi:MAG TPA: late competence protein ComER [Bacilli bacterium]
MNIGFIGTGSMGSILIEALIESNALDPEQITISNRTRSKTERLVKQYSGIKAVATNKEVALNSEILFLCVKPMEFKRVIDEIRQSVHPAQIIVSITSAVLLEHLEEQLTGKIAKIIPSITNFEHSGACLCIYGSRITSLDRELIEGLLRHMSEPIVISEEYTRITSDISSCGPAFLAFFIQKFVEAAVLETGISSNEATLLASEMVLGTGKLLTTGGFTPQALQKRVSVPGGITAEALRVLEREMDDVFVQLIRTTHAKFAEDLEKVHASFYGQKVK